MCRILGVSRAQYYRYRSPKPSKRRAEDAGLKQRILRIFAEFKQRYGVMKIHHELNLELQPLQLRCSPRRISRLMKELDSHSVTVNKWKAASASKTKVEQRPKLQEQISHTINPIKSVFSLIFIFYGLNLTGGSSGEKLFGCLIASLPAR
ncbi:IS3 family transposase [Latilactobacillus curvatus]|uniref:IS3 family transposase n=1 Tax=Latilactobacillus curvatus TaxID=28038 RepID=UPI0034658396